MRDEVYRFSLGLKSKFDLYQTFTFTGIRLAITMFFRTIAPIQLERAAKQTFNLVSEVSTRISLHLKAHRLAGYYLLYQYSKHLNTLEDI